MARIAGARQSMAWLHIWTGLIVGWVLYFVFMTGAAGYFDEEISLWMQPKALPVLSKAALPAADIVSSAQALLQEKAPDAERWSLDPSWDRVNRGWYINWSAPGQNRAMSSWTLPPASSGGLSSFGKPMGRRAVPAALSITLYVRT